jgi:hypothetical protein
MLTNGRIKMILPRLNQWRSEIMMTNLRAVASTLLWLFVLVVAACSVAAGQSDSPNPTTNWPTKSWPKGTPASVGLDEEVLRNFDVDLARGKYLLMDSVRAYRCDKPGAIFPPPQSSLHKQVFEIRGLRDPSCPWWFTGSFACIVRLCHYPEPSSFD